MLVNGVCLTAARTANGELRRRPQRRDPAPQRARRRCESGDRVNLELPLRAQDRLGGHIVQGHVDAVGEVAARTDEGSARNLVVSAPESVLRYVVEKGSVTVDGVSLTVTSVDERGFGVSLIPETLERTNLGTAAPGRRVNLEVDVLAKYVEKLIAAPDKAGPGHTT